MLLPKGIRMIIHFTFALDHELINLPMTLLGVVLHLMMLLWGP